MIRLRWCGRRFRVCSTANWITTKKSRATRMNNSTHDPVKAFVLAAHSDLDTVQKMLADRPELLNIEYDWGAMGGLETPIGAAAHVGNRAIAEFLLAKGAPSNICVAAMLGKDDEVKAA